MVMFIRNIENPKPLRCYIYKQKTLLHLSIVCSKHGHKYKKIFKVEDSIETLKIIGSINDIEMYQKIYNHV